MTSETETFTLLTPYMAIIFISEFGVHLAELTVDPQGALAIRQVSLTKCDKRC